MDSILLVGTKEPKLDALLEKLGAKVFNSKKGSIGALTEPVIDAIIWEDEDGDDLLSLYDVFRGTPSCKDASIVFAGAPARIELLKGKADLRLETVSIPYSVGTLVARIMGQLRQRKMESGGTLADINAQLRDLTDRFRKELEEAREIQESLLPKSFPPDSRYEIAVEYEPLDGVGGDWYGFQAHESGAISMQIADVTGHGLPAAFLGSMTKLALVASGKESPGELFERMNSLLTPQLPSGRFITMAGFRYEPDSGDLQFARAGHLPGILVRASGEIEQLKGDGFALGFMDEAFFVEVKTKLEKGDAFVLCTDGITEVQNRSGVMLGLEGTANAAKGETAKDMVQSILARVEEFREERLLKDDVTLIVLKRKE